MNFRGINSVIICLLLCSLTIQCTVDTEATLPVVSTLTVSDITFTTARTVSAVSASGGGEVIARGICWGISPNPTLESSSFSVDASGLGSFNSEMSELLPSQTYFVRSYASNSAGVAYGNELTFKTSLTLLPNISTFTIGNISARTAAANLIVTGSAAPVTSKGFCWSLNPNPTIALTTKIDIAGNDEFGLIPDLTPNTTYYIRAYAANLLGVVYSEERSFITANGVPEVSIEAISFLSISSFSVKGKELSNGGETVTDWGFCWSTNPNPTTDLATKISLVPGSIIPPKTFIGSITGLSQGLIYYVRAYAKNSVTTAYSKEINIRIPAVGSTVTDIDGNIYEMKFIGMQYWMNRNLMSTRYQDGSAITTNLDKISWSGTTFGAYAIYNGGSYTNLEVNNNAYGKLYNFYAVVDPRGLCPIGTHIPTDAEWTTLALGNRNGALKEAGYEHWATDYGEGNNATGFTAIPGGERNANGDYLKMGSSANWWSANVIPSNPTSAYSALMWTNDVIMFGGEKNTGYSVRCLADY